jgi:TIR domain
MSSTINEKPNTESPLTTATMITESTTPSLPAPPSKGKGKGKGKGEPAQVFISYSWSTKPICRRLKDDLEVAGFHCWMDEEVMKPGAELFASIDEGIRSARVVVACLSPEYCLSKNCIREFSLSCDVERMIIPAIVSSIGQWPPSGTLGPLLTGRLYVNLVESNYKQNVAQLVEALQQVI